MAPNKVRIYVGTCTIEAPTEKQALDLYFQMTGRKALTYVLLELNDDGTPSGPGFKVTE